LVVPSRTYRGAYYPDPSFQTQNLLHRGDPDIRASIDFISDVAVSDGFETSMNEKYEQTIGDGRTAPVYKGEIEGKNADRPPRSTI